VILEASRSQRVVEFYVGTDEDELALVPSEETVKACLEQFGVDCAPLSRVPMRMGISSLLNEDMSLLLLNLLGQLKIAAVTARIASFLYGTARSTAVKSVLLKRI
jgi:hypothetical protein